MKPRLTLAAADAAPAIAALRTAAAAELTAAYDSGPWSGTTTERGILFAMRRSSVYVARDRGRIVATLTLATKKPWTIEKRYFTPVKRPLYLVAMAVEPARQRQGIGRRCLEDAVTICKGWPADALWLDAYDAEAGAGDFYRACGFIEVGRATYRNAPLIYFERLV
jgi:GNAT superfamily N-acetyltransferase